MARFHMYISQSTRELDSEEIPFAYLFLSFITTILMADCSQFDRYYLLYMDNPVLSVRKREECPIFRSSLPRDIHEI